ncbi:class I SAM-dependent methyltransferase [Marinobacter sp.]|uniref:class I SAM-dependent methyltransferase n=1 Tax=Marinobacter sp. TaxID=50741 RepID=UPI003A8D6D05
MSGWTAGYVADIGYTFGYYNELNPLRIKLAFLNAGLALPQNGTACELGFGQGVSVNIHAAATICRWHGTDFNPAQAGFAQELASASGSGACLADQAFDEFARRSDLPEFDYIGLHGIWSWISDENRDVIVDFIRRKLKVSGVLYISYNTLPGWAAFAPMRHIMAKHADVMGAEGRGIVSRVDGAIDFADRLLATNPLFSRANPQVAERVHKLKEQNRQYLAHEYFNQDWQPMHFADMAEWLEPAKLQFACSANYLDHVDAVNLTAEQQALLGDIPDQNFRQGVRDFMVNQQFRKDYWVKGLRKLSPLDQAEQLRQQRIVLVIPRTEVPLKVSGALGEANLSEQIYAPVLDSLADYKPRSLGQVEQSIQGQGINFAQLLQAILVLAGAGHLAAVQDEAAIGKARKQTERLNAHLTNRARGDSDVTYLASPVTGGAFPVGRFHQMFLAAIAQGKRQPSDWAAFAWQLLQAQGQSLLKNGQVLETSDENLAELVAQATEFAEKRMPILKALQIA